MHLFILVILLISYLEITGKDNNEWHSLNILHISVALLVFHFERLGRNVNDKHPLNI